MATTVEPTPIITSATSAAAEHAARSVLTVPRRASAAWLQNGVDATPAREVTARTSPISSGDNPRPRRSRT
jgi:hypothetical protein